MPGRIMLCGALALTTLVCARTPASADGELSVGDLRTLCFAPATAEHCRYFIYGVIEGATFGDGFKTPGGQICVAPTATSEDLRDAVKAALSSTRAAEGDSDSPAASFVTAVTTKLFPCAR